MSIIWLHNCQHIGYRRMPQDTQHFVILLIHTQKLKNYEIQKKT